MNAPSAVDIHTCTLFPAVYPNVCSMKLVAMSDKRERETRIDFWDSVYGQYRQHNVLYY